MAIISIQILSITRIRTNNEQSEKIKIEMKTMQQSKNNTKYRRIQRQESEYNILIQNNKTGTRNLSNHLETSPHTDEY